MAVLKPFRGIRPVPDKVKDVASRPYDVLDRREAREEAAGNKHSFLHVVKPEIDFPGEVDPCSPKIYRKGKENFERMVQDGVMFRDDREYLYVYRQVMGNHVQTGLVGCNSIDDYLNNVIKKHELTRAKKEEDRKNHVRVGRMNAEPVFFSYPAVSEIDRIIEKVTDNPPEYDFTADDGVKHIFWVIRDTDSIGRLVELFERDVRSIYVADGHHRTAAAALVGKELRDADPNSTGQEEYNYFMSVLFPDNQLKICDYNRVIKDLNGHTPDAFKEKVRESFELEELGSRPFKPGELHTFGMYLEGRWYKLRAKEGTYDDNDPVGALDVTVLSSRLLEPVFNITDLRNDDRIDFVGGIRGLEELERRVDSGEMQVAFSMYPVSMDQLIAISDSGKIMPPKTTWFEPKLRSGLVIHKFEDEN